MELNKYKYYLSGETVEDAIIFFTQWGDMDLNFVAEDAAENLSISEDIDANDDDWPLDIIILDSEDNELGLFEIEMRLEPVFHATKKKVKQG